MLRFSESSLYTLCSNRAAGGETENLGFDSRGKKKTAPSPCWFWCPRNRRIPGVFNRERNIWDEKFITYMYRAPNLEKREYVNPMQISKIPTLYSLGLLFLWIARSRFDGLLLTFRNGYAVRKRRYTTTKLCIVTSQNRDGTFFLFLKKRESCC
jgi:hypothetical protein